MIEIYVAYESFKGELELVDSAASIAEAIERVNQIAWEDDAEALLRESLMLKRDGQVVAMAMYIDNDADPKHPLLQWALAGRIETYRYEEFESSYRPVKV
jgi:type VI protein secretion system component Hcp